MKCYNSCIQYWVDVLKAVGIRTCLAIWVAIFYLFCRAFVKVIIFDSALFYPFSGTEGHLKVVCEIIETLVFRIFKTLKAKVRKLRLKEFRGGLKARYFFIIFSMSDNNLIYFFSKRIRFTPDFRFRSQLMFFF